MGGRRLPGTGAAATEDRVEQAALPSIAAATARSWAWAPAGLVVESEDAVHERGMRGIVEVLGSETSQQRLPRHPHGREPHLRGDGPAGDCRRAALRPQPLRHGAQWSSSPTRPSPRPAAAAPRPRWIALRNTFGEAANDIVVANTKGFTGHPMGVGMEDVIAVKILEYGIVPPVPNFKEADPDLGALNLSRGGRYPVQYALHLAAGFGSQIAMTLTAPHSGRPGPHGHQAALSALAGRHRRLRHGRARSRQTRAACPGAGPAAPPARGQRWRYGTGPTLPHRVAGQRPGQGRPNPGRRLAPMIRPGQRQVPLPPISAPAPASTAPVGPPPAAPAPLHRGGACAAAPPTPGPRAQAHRATDRGARAEP